MRVIISLQITNNNQIIVFSAVFCNLRVSNQTRLFLCIGHRFEGTIVFHHYFALINGLNVGCLFQTPHKRKALFPQANTTAAPGNKEIKNESNRTDERIKVNTLFAC